MVEAKDEFSANLEAITNGYNLNYTTLASNHSQNIEHLSKELEICLQTLHS